MWISALAETGLASSEIPVCRRLPRPRTPGASVCVQARLKAREMGGGSSTPLTPLQCILNNWKLANKGNNYDIKLDKEKMRSLCEVDWPTLDTGWPSEGSFDPVKVNPLWAAVIQTRLDQIPYVNIWKGCIDQNPKEQCKKKIMPCSGEKAQLQVASDLDRTDVDIVQQTTPYVPSAPFQPPPSQSPRGQAPRAVEEQGGETEATDPKAVLQMPKKSVYPTHELNQQPEDLPCTPGIHARTPENTAVNYQRARLIMKRWQAAAGGSDGLLRLAQIKIKESEEYLRAFLSTSELVLNYEEQRRLKEMERVKGITSNLMPLRQAWDAPGPAPREGEPLPRTSTFQHIPLSTTDLNTTPTWEDCQQTLQTSEEVQRVRTEARRLLADDKVDEGERLLQYPLTDPNWDHNEADARQKLKSYRSTLIQGLIRDARKPTNMAKVSEIIQKPDESPAMFLERLKEAFRIWTPLNPEEGNNEILLKTTFIAQSTPDIRKKILKKGGLEGHSLEWTIATAQRVYDNRDEEKERKREKYRKKKLNMLALAIGEKQQGEEEMRKGRGRATSLLSYTR